MKHKHYLILFILLIPLSVFSQDYYTISGIITDSKSGVELDGIDIVVVNKTTGTISNQKGSYSLILHKGTYKVTYSGRGYNKEEITVELNSDQVQMVELSPKQQKQKRKDLKLKEPKHTEILTANIK